MSEQTSGPIRIRTANSTWVFDPDRMRFWRAPRDLDVDSPAVLHDWQPYYGLDIDAASGAITVTLNEAGTRLLRAWQDPPLAAQEPTAELERMPVVEP